MLTATDTAIAACGATFGFWSISQLESLTGIPFYAGTFASSTMIIFSGVKPPPPRNIFLGTLGGASAAVAVCTLLGDGELARSVAVGLSLVWFKVSGTVYPPGAALGAVFFDSEARQSLGWSFVLCPCLTGNAVLYSIATALAPLRKQARVSLTMDALREAEAGVDREALQKLFGSFDSNGDGVVDASELKVLLKIGVGADVSDEDCEAIVRTVDTDGDATMTFDEFIDFLERR